MGTMAGGATDGFRHILSTARLRLRELGRGDLDDLQAVLGDPVSMRYYPKPFDRDMTAAWIERCLKSYARNGFGLWAVVDKRDDELVGDCGLTWQLVDGVDELEIGYHLRRAYHGQGLATEAAAGCRDYAFDVLGRDRVISWMGPDNTPSRRVAERLGMRFEKATVNRYGKPAVVYAITRAERDAAGGR